MTLKSNFKYLCFISLLVIVSGCATDGKRMANAGSDCLVSQKTESSELPPEAFRNADDLLTVDCLLPGQRIQIGMYEEWVTPPRPAIISAGECKVQGGQYALTSDKDGRETALNVWQGCANEGDMVAQNYMGEIYGRSWGEIKPDYVRAAEWYRKSAEQGYSRALNNFGFLYEHGLGVPQNKQLALDLYRKAMGEVKPVELDQSIKVEINELQSKLNQALQTIENLKMELSESKEAVQRKQDEIERFKQQRGVVAEDQPALKKLQEELTQSSRRENTLQRQLSDAKQELDTFRNQLAKTETRAAFERVPEMGKYYALIIGINNYQFPLENLKTPVNDARRVEEVLRKKYGFETTLLVDEGHIKPTRKDIFGTLIKLGKKIKDDDNLLIYFAGHGELATLSAYWLPQDAEFRNDSSWISTDDLTRKIAKEGGVIKARHVLVVADSCYSAAMLTSWLEPSAKQVYASLPQGLITRSDHSMRVRSIRISPSILSPQPDKSSVESRIGWVMAKHESISRKELTSGSIEPVLDEEIGNGLSVFANAFINALEANENIIGAYEIYAKIGPQVTEQVMRMGESQAPVYAPIPKTGDNHGEFFFNPRRN
jgi:hypothetical protein